MLVQNEPLHLHTYSLVRKYHKRGDLNPYETVEAVGNAFLNAGITNVFDLLTGLGGSAWNSAHSRLGVGDGTLAADATQTGLQGTHTYFQAVDSGFPTASDQLITFKATFDTQVAQFHWHEWVVDNGTYTLNRKVHDFGTKGAEVWVLTVTISL